jgi:hypothetical protein
MLPHHFPINYIRPTPFIFKASQRNRNEEYQEVLVIQWPIKQGQRKAWHIPSPKN